MYVSRFDREGKSIANKIFQGVENGSIRIEKKMFSNGKRLDQLAQEYYGSGLNWWIIAAASGIRWHLGVGNGKYGTNIDTGEEILIYIPNIDDIIRLKITGN